jgi:hypothetical protein
VAKGVTNQPLVIWVWREWYSRPEILALMRQGHTVTNMGQVFRPTLGVYAGSPEPDLIIHPAAGWTVELLEPEKREKDGSLYWPYLDAGLTRARARRKKAK